MFTAQTITKTLEEFTNNRDFNNRKLWYDWFCRDSSLQNKGRVLLTRLKAISASSKFDNDTTFVWFKNNCPMVGGLYDDFRIADIKSGDNIYCVSPCNQHGMAEVWGVDNDFAEPLLIGTWREIKAWFLAS